MKIAQSRKAFVTEYVCLFLLLVFSIKMFFLVYLILPMLTYIELKRTKTRYHFGEKKFSILNGFIDIDKKNIYYHPLGYLVDMHIRQTPMQRLLKIGTIEMRADNQKTLLKNIDKPHKLLDFIEDHIEKNRN